MRSRHQKASISNRAGNEIVQVASSYLNNEHGFWRDFHVMTQLEIREKHYCLRHTYYHTS